MLVVQVSHGSGPGLIITGLFAAGPIPVLAKPTGEEHPTPDSVPARKSSIIQGECERVSVICHHDLLLQAPSTPLVPPLATLWANHCQIPPWPGYCD